mmetsp:Transcript_7696/g.23296  ORF Transcript_7696/g.23296 Transcript_7696/m.23296 type:complete len:149 (+) Transcript_7696:65-511(+)
MANPAGGIGSTDEAAIRDLPPPPSLDESNRGEPVDEHSLKFLYQLHKQPCFRDATLTGMSAGFLMSALRMMRTRSSIKGLDAFMWTTTLVSCGTWIYCRREWRRERADMQLKLELQLKGVPVAPADDDSALPPSPLPPMSETPPETTI